MDELSRTLMTASCSDCDTLPKVADAGRIIAHVDLDVQIMHNGLKVLAGGYHGSWMAHVIRALRGHHEPQEELLFYHLLKRARHDSLIVELGCFWAYYSMWYLTEVPGSVSVCVEPDRLNLDVGRRNAELNQLAERMKFVRAAIGEVSGQGDHIGEATGRRELIDCLNFDGVVNLVEGRFIELLHMDVQGSECGLLNSMRGKNIKEHVRFVFASTHHRSISGHPDTHLECVDLLQALGASILAQYDIQESFSGDGLIVASFNPVDALYALPPVSRNNAVRSLFPRR